MFWWVELDLFCLECNEVSIREFGVSMGLAWLWAACLLMLRMVFLLCWRTRHGLFCTGICWLLGGDWFQCRYGDFRVTSCLLMFPEVRSSLMFSNFGVKPPASGFQSFS